VQVTRPGTLAGIFALCALASWLAVRKTFTGLPLFPVGLIWVLLGLAIAEALVARHIRRRISRPAMGKPLAAIAVARLVALAKASSTAGAALGGLAAGFLIYLLSLLDKTIPAHDAKVAGATFAAAAALVGAALYLEHCCRAPKPPDDDEDESIPRSDHWQWHS
jgi:Protein of unknown function (DUF3180)